MPRPAYDLHRSGLLSVGRTRGLTNNTSCEGHSSFDSAINSTHPPSCHFAGSDLYARKSLILELIFTFADEPKHQGVWNNCNQTAAPDAVPSPAFHSRVRNETSSRHPGVTCPNGLHVSLTRCQFDLVSLGHACQLDTQHRSPPDKKNLGLNCPHKLMTTQAPLISSLRAVRVHTHWKNGSCEITP